MIVETTVWVLVACIGSMIGGGLLVVVSYIVPRVYKTVRCHACTFMARLLSFELRSRARPTFERQVAIKMGLLIAGMIIIGVLMDWVSCDHSSFEYELHCSDDPIENAIVVKEHITDLDDLTTIDCVPGSVHYIKKVTKGK